MEVHTLPIYRKKSWPLDHPCIWQGKFYVCLNVVRYILGDKKLRSVLTDGTKSSTTLKKAMVAPKRFVRRRKQSPDRRDRSRSPAAKRPDRSSSGAGSSGSGAKKASYSDSKRKYRVDDGTGSSKDSSNRWTRSK